MRKLHVAAAQIHSGGTVAENLARVERQVVSAAAVGVDVILFAECAMQGYDYDLTPALARAMAQPVTGPDCCRVVDMARKHRISILIGFLERDGNRIYNSVLVARPDGSRAVERKHMLGATELRSGLTPGPRERTVFTFNGVRTAIVICADSGIKGLNAMLKRLRVEHRFCPTGGGGQMKDMLRERDLLTARGRRLYLKNLPRVFKAEGILSRQSCPTCGFTSANALGPVGRRTCHQGHCMIVDSNRVMRAQCPGTIVLEHQQDQMIHALLRFP